MAKIILFDGTDLSGFTKRDGSPAEWEVKDGAMLLCEYAAKSCSAA